MLESEVDSGKEMGNDSCVDVELSGVELGIDGLKILIGVRFDRPPIPDISQSGILVRKRKE